MNQNTILAEIKQYYPFPKDYEIGFGIKNNSFNEFETGNANGVYIDLNNCVSFFHTHPEYAEPTFSKIDIRIVVNHKFKFVYLGYLDQLFFINILKLPEPFKKRLFSSKRTSNKLQDEFNSYLKEIKLF
jgi:hypothetical protein